MEYFPDSWKLAKVIPIPKSGKPPENPESYRPISLFSNLSKVFEKVLKEVILKHISENNIFINEQFGFRAHHSSTHQVLRICNHIKSNRDIVKSTGMVLLDIEKAFDTVWHDGLLYKLIHLRFPPYICKIVQSFLTRRRFVVQVNSGVSDLMFFNSGVPQGSVLAPILYNIYVSDFPKLPNCHTAIFADDTAIFSSHELALNIESNLLNVIKIVENGT